MLTKIVVLIHTPSLKRPLMLTMNANYAKTPNQYSFFKLVLVTHLNVKLLVQICFNLAC